VEENPKTVNGMEIQKRTGMPGRHRQVVQVAKEEPIMKKTEATL
jgi:hypothetical protein